MDSSAEIKLLWMVVRTNNLGTRFLIEKGLSQDAAAQLKTDILAKQRKQHGQDYSLHSYDEASRPRCLPGDVLPDAALS